MEAREKYIANVVSHEVCHLLAVHTFGKDIRPHGKEFKQLVRNLGFPKCIGMSKTDVFKNSKASINQSKKTMPYRYKCGCSNDVGFTIQQHNKQVADSHAYRCTSCKGDLTYVYTLSLL